MSEAAALPIAHILGTPLFDTPKDLYIPPEALQIFLQTFEGPLDLLLYLIRRQNLDVLDIPMSQLTAQYLSYVHAMREHQLELAADYLLMAALLIDIKSRMLLPNVASGEDDASAEDPRVELVRRLVEYEQMQQAARRLNDLPQAGRDFSWVNIALERLSCVQLPAVSLSDLSGAWATLRQRAHEHQHHTILSEELSVRETMSQTLSRLREREGMEFLDFFDATISRAKIVVQFLALLELCRESLIELVQERPTGALFVRLSGRA